MTQQETDIVTMDDW